MIKSKPLVFFAIVMIATMLTLGNLVEPVQANTVGAGTPTPTGTPIIKTTDIPGVIPSVEEQEELKAIIQAYFETRYVALSASQPSDFRLEGFGDLVSNEANAQRFVNAELGKLAVEIKHAQLNHLRYVEYRYFLTFTDIAVDPASQMATVFLVEESEFVDEISTELAPDNPFISHKYNIKHVIVLRKEQDQWRITSDDYKDLFWRLLKQEHVSADELLNTMEALPRPALQNKSASAVVTTSPLPDDTSSHAYDRAMAVQYALDHARNYNPNYPDYNSGPYAPPWGDCTNFVSQAIYEGGNASMFIPSPLPSPSPDGQSGWYLLNDLQRASAWNHVEYFHTFVTSESWTEPYPEGEWYGEGPQGYDVAINELMLGDVIQYDWTGNGSWDHSAIVVNLVNGEPYVATHTPDDVRHYTAFAPSYDPSLTQLRYIHIERSNGYPPVKIQTTSAADDAGGNPGGSCPDTNYDTGNNYFGGCSNGALYGVTSGFLFRNIQIPRGAQVKYAYVTFTTDGTYVVNSQEPGVYAPLTLNIYGENTSAPADYSSMNTPGDRTNLTGGVIWPINRQIDPEHLYDTWYWKGKRSTPDIKDIIHAITGLPTWAAGNPLSLLFKNGDLGSTYARRVTAYEALYQNPNGLTPARLIAAYDLNLYSPSYTSSGAQDGMVLESRETSETGGSIDAVSTVFNVGDDASDRQYRGILHFDTSALPDNTIILSAVLKIKQLSLAGTNPFTTHGNLNVEIKSGAFDDNPALAKRDFQAAADLVQPMAFNSTPTDSWYTATLSSAAFPYISLTSSTQFRLAFQLGDDDDNSADFIAFYSGNDATVANRPQLIITHYIPAP